MADLGIKVSIQVLSDQAMKSLNTFNTAFENKMAGLESRLRGASAATEQFTNKWHETLGLARTAGVAMTAAGAGIAAVAKGGIEAAMEMEGYRAKLLVAMRDATKAAEMYDWAKKKAAETPFEMADVVDATTRLQMYGLSATEWFDKVGNMAGAMGRNVQQAVEAIADAVSGGGLERLKEFGVSGAQLKELGWTGDYTAKGIQTLKNALLELMETRFGGGMEKMMQTSKGALSNFSDAVFQTKAAIGDALFPALKAVTPILTSFATMLAKLSQTRAGQSMIVLTAIIGGLLLVFGPALILIGNAVAAWNTLTAALGRNAAAAAEAAAANAAAGTAAAAGGSGAAAARGGILGKVLAPVGTALATAWGALAPVLSAITAGAGSVVATISAALLPAISAVVGGVASIIAAIAALPLGTIAAVVAAIIAAGAAIWAAVTHWDKLKEAVTAVWNAIVAALETGWDGFVTWLGGLPEAIGGSMATLANAVLYGIGYALSFIGSLPGRIATALQTGWTAVVEFFSNLPGMIQSGATAAGQAVVKWTIDMGTAIAQWANSSWQKLVDWFTGLPGMIRTGFSNALQAVLEALRGMWQAIEQFFVALWNWIKSIPGRVLDALRGIGEGIKAGFSKTFSPEAFEAGRKAGGIQKRQMGGPVIAGEPYIVGENGPEVFIPGKTGFIVPKFMPAIVGGTGGLSWSGAGPATTTASSITWSSLRDIQGALQSLVLGGKSNVDDQLVPRRPGSEPMIVHVRFDIGLDDGLLVREGARIVDGPSGRDAIIRLIDSRVMKRGL